jgi:hypothetical protein
MGDRIARLHVASILSISLRDNDENVCVRDFVVACSRSCQHEAFVGLISHFPQDFLRVSNDKHSPSFNCSSHHLEIRNNASLDLGILSPEEYRQVANRT